MELYGKVYYRAWRLATGPYLKVRGERGQIREWEMLEMLPATYMYRSWKSTACRTSCIVLYMLVDRDKMLSFQY